MAKRIGLVILVLACMLALTACGCEHQWQETEPRRGHTLQSDDAITTCSTCNRSVEVFYDAKGKAVYETEFDPAADGSYINPVTVYGNRFTQWYENGELQTLRTQNCFCVDGKLYYRGSLRYGVSANTREDLIAVAKKHVQYEYAKYYENKDQDILYLSSNKLLTDNRGQVFAVVDVEGNRYILIHKGSTGFYPEDTVVVEYDWKS